MKSLGPARALSLVSLTAACGSVPPSSTPDASVCSTIQMQASPASAEGRWLIGAASRYPADTALAARGEALHRSQRARREAAWQAVARTLAPVPVAHPTGVSGATLPRFRTWYDREDVNRVFQRLYGALTPAQRTAGARFTDTALDEAFGWNVDFVRTLPEWTTARLDSFAASFDNPSVLASATGIQRIGLSPDTVRHLVASYPEILRCLNLGAPTPFADGPAQRQQLARVPISLAPCGTAVFGPYFVASGGELTAHLSEASAGTEIRVVDGVSPVSLPRCRASGSDGCTVTGPGTFTVRVSTLGVASSGMLDVRYTPPDAAVTACLQGVFPPAAATVAQEWRRVGSEFPFPQFDTSASGLGRRLAPSATATWGTGDGNADPDERSVYTMRLASGASFRLAAMHIRTREVDRWLNITLWWSPSPDTDFGADRPESVRALGAPWTSYKMCVATDFDEQDTDADGGFAQDVPSLAAALRAVYEGRGAPSWCSNPYIDAGPGLVRSNCVGCHQHAMSGVRPAEVQNDHVRYPSNGRTQVRNNFPADGFWGIDGGDQLGSVFSETVDFYRSNR